MGTIVPDECHPVPTMTGAQPKPTSRLCFIDNIRVYLTILVMLHHLNLDHTDVLRVLEGRFGTSGHDEKRSRS